jgi:diaminopropionate ammonia-lyase
MFHEIDEQLEASTVWEPDVVVAQIGVGSLATAVVRHYRAAGRDSRPRIVGVEPIDAACAYASIRQGQPVVVPGPHRSMMAGLNCGTLSSPAWPWLRRGLDAVAAVGDDRAADAMRMLALAGVASGESGAAGLAAVIELIEGPDAENTRAALGLGPGARILLLSTEGVTDTENYGRVVGKS